MALYSIHLLLLLRDKCDNWITDDISSIIIRTYYP
jgi:hypothetical protein